ncbi:(2,3-dihydroxybenzoyl)adenylate synthase [Streptomyces subrutilus]|uniref:2,3-dihydroxybenzoyl adenylate synthase n=1 Tax=Streptomyces subrutilus TaxID=36818 RepID=A0A1E5PLR6_9ACTN|nr:AMP-binding protein [Streptomyces subrutilus]OEJ30511.1 2,3-dihydroxybenzoyl adenylate synthase [Streptomyces subrutilus]
MTTMLDGCTPWPREYVDRYWSAGHWRGNTLDNLLRGWALQYGPRTALVHGGTRLTYAALNRRADRMAAGFRLRGLRPGQRVVVQLPNVPEFVTTVFALMRAGAVPVLCPVAYRAPEVSHLVRLTQAVGYVGPSVRAGYDHTAMAADIAAQGPFLRRVFTLDAPGTASPYGGLTTDPAGCQYSPLGSIDAAPEPPLALSADQVAFFLCSGAAATAPRLVPRTHNDYAYQARAAAELVSLTESDVYLAALPAESDFAFGSPGIVGTLSAGGTVVLAEGSEPAACLAVIARERVTVTSVVPAVARLWLGALCAAPADVSSLRLVQFGGDAALDRQAAERLARAWGCRLQQVFGMPEGVLALTRPADPEETVLITQGRPLSPDDEIRIVGTDGRDVPEGESGELLARGPHTPRGYYRAPEHNARSYTPDGYFRTGALARRTPDGGLVVTGRLGDDPSGLPATSG